MRLPFPSSAKCLTLTVLLAALAACNAVGPDYHLPGQSVYSKVQKQPVALHGEASQVDVNADALEGDWWRLYKAPYLNSLIEEALKESSELRVAEARLRQAWAAYEEAAGAGDLDWNMNASVSRSRASGESMGQNKRLPPVNLAEADLGVSYALDLFGQIRRGIEQAGANTEAAQAARDLARINVAAGVAGAYLGICNSNHQLAVARHSLKLQQDSREVSFRLHNAGRGTITDVTRANAQVAALKAAIPPLQAERKAAAYQLAALLDLTPDKVPQRALDCDRVPDLERPIPVGDGAALLRRRPDVRQAERQLAAATAGIGVAVADLYPKVGFSASIGSSGLRDDFGEAPTQTFSIGPLLSWNLPSRANRARVKLARAGADESLAQFDQVVLNALRETQTQLDQYGEDLKRERSLRDARDRAASAAEDERRLYKDGRVPYLDSLDAERDLASQESSLAVAQRQLSQDQINLFLALGGGWRDDPKTQPKTSVSEDAAAE